MQIEAETLDQFIARIKQKEAEMLAKVSAEISLLNELAAQWKKYYAD